MAALAYDAISFLAHSVSPFDLVTARNITNNPITGIHFLTGIGIPYRDTWLSISGTTKDRAGNFVQREVVAIREKNFEWQGSVVSNATTGAYSISVPYTDAHIVIDREPSENALIFRDVTPV